LGVDGAQILVAQTGLIGIPFPQEVAVAALPQLLRELGGDEEASVRAAEAILTTDTKMKTALVEGDNGGFLVGAMAKGAAMLAPNMATMLALLTTDAHVEPKVLHALLKEAVGDSFNRLSVDGCTSTNDTVVVLASGKAGPASPDALGLALQKACDSLAAQMADDAEGATKVASIIVTGARSDGDAHVAAKKVAESLLVKCSLNGEDPYWGRVVSELGSAGVAFEMDSVSVAYGGVILAKEGIAVGHDEGAVRAHMAMRHIEITCDLGIGEGRGVATATDLSYGYIDENRTTS
jgi:glutamate N-acetyltransferase/amino-acid N-acetyltransferase